MTRKPKALRDLQRSYRAERAAILEDPDLSWEKKLKAVSELFARYAARRDELEEIEWTQ